MVASAIAQDGSSHRKRKRARIAGRNGLSAPMTPTLHLSFILAIYCSSAVTIEAFTPVDLNVRATKNIHRSTTPPRTRIRSTPMVLPLLKEPEEVTSINSRQANTNMELFSPPTAPVLASSTDIGGTSRRHNPQFYPNADQRYQASDWWEIMKTLPKSSILRTTKWPVLTIMAWSVVLSSIHCAFCCIGYTGALAQTLACPIPSTIPHAATVTALGLLLVFRTTTAYQKFDEGRHIWEHILSVSRNLTRLIYLYPEFSVERRVRIFQLLAAYPFFLQRHVSPNQVMNETPEPLPDTHAKQSRNPLHAVRMAWRNSGPNPQIDAKRTALLESSTYIDRYALPWSMFPDPAVRSVANSSNRPLWACDRMAQEILAVTYTETYTSMERSHILSFIGQLSEAVGECERIQRTAVPLNYARHSLRGLTLWLFTLPLALIHSFGWWTAPVMGLAAWLMYGIYQIGYSIEDPFQGSLRLATLCNGIFRDVMCDSRRATAFNVSVGEYEEWKNLPL